MIEWQKCDAGVSQEYFWGQQMRGGLSLWREKDMHKTNHIKRGFLLSWGHKEDRWTSNRWRVPSTICTLFVQTGLSKQSNVLEPFTVISVDVKSGIHHTNITILYINRLNILCIQQNCLKGHLSWSFYFLYLLIVNSYIINFILDSISSELWNKTDI